MSKMKMLSDYHRECPTCGMPLFIFKQGGDNISNYTYYIGCKEKENGGHVQVEDLTISEALEYLREGGESDSKKASSANSVEGTTAPTETD